MRSQLNNALNIQSNPVSRSSIKRSFHIKPVINQSKRPPLINIDMNSQTENQKEQLEDLQFQKNMLETFQIMPRDQVIIKQRGKKSIEQYYKHYKSLDRTLQQNQHFNIPNSGITDMLDKSENHFVLPSKVGIFKKEKTDKDTLKLQYMRYGDKYAQLLSSGISGYNNINQFQLQNNRISSQSSNALIQQIMKNAKLINISNNRIGKVGCDQISLQISQKYCRLEVLNLGGNKLGDTAVKDLFQSILKNQNLRILDLSDNNLSDNASQYLGQIVKTCSIFELYIGWNQLRASSGKEIFSALTENNYLKVIDISGNSLGRGESFVNEIENFMQKNTDVYHLDLSSNFFSYEDSIAISKSLESNKTIYGFHFEGNYGFVESRGFLIVQENQQQLLAGLHNKRQIKGIHTLEREVYRSDRDIDLADCCWICDGWQEKEFRWDIGLSGEQSRDPLFIHFNFENFRSNYFGKKDGQQQSFFSYKRMMPPGNLDYFYSSQESEMIAKNQHKKNLFDQKNIKCVQIFDGTTKDVLLEQINYCYVEKNTGVFTKYYEPQISLLPRVKDPMYVPPKIRKAKIKWTFPISLMAQWRQDDDQLITKCFEFDWEYCKIPRIIKNKPEDLQKVKDFLQQKYKYIKDTYKHYASQNPIGDVWAIQKLQFADLVNQTNLIDNKKLKDADVDIKWTATTSIGDKGNFRNPERGITRYQLMEVLVRIAEEKYILKSKKSATYFEAITQMWNEHLEKEFTSHSPHTWREQRYWNEECDDCLKNYKPVIEHIYRRHSKKKVKPGQSPFMCLEELNNIITFSGLLNDDKFGSQVANFAFNLSMMTQVDEQTQDRIFQMSIVEFYEALARIAEEANLQLLPGIPNVEEQTQLSYEQRKNLLLAYKLEALIVRLFNTCSDAGFKATQNQITTSFFSNSKQKNEQEEEYSYQELSP
ncbi:hypothetical protein ABPG72_004711 [Tetrahymena utriculariae]